MLDQISQIHIVRRPADGAEIPLTCTQEQLENVWIPAGYQVVSEIAKETTSDKPKRSR
ncbi:MAG: hypothetical protein ABFD54_11430 [Armatimonadota bacterium]